MARVLVINHPESDYGATFLYNGLCRVLGAENVYDYPIKYSYHGVNHEYSTPSIARGFTSPLPWMPAYPIAWGEEAASDGVALMEAVRRGLRDGFFDLVVVESMRPMAMSAARGVWDWVKRSGVPRVVHEGEDFQQFCVAQLKELEPTLHLKREVSRRRPQSCDWPVVPFPFSFPDTDRTLAEITTQVAQDVDVSFMCGGTWDYRFDVLRALDEAVDLSVGLGTSQRERLPNSVRVYDLKDWWTYLDAMQRSSVAVSVRGFGHDTCRYWEAAAASLLAHDRIDLDIPNDYEPNVDCVQFDGPQELVEKLRHVLSPGVRDQYEVMREACRAKTMRYHTNSARARMMLERAGVHP